MPLYEFRCQDCQNVSEFQLKLADPNPDKCPQCEGGPMQKLISNTAFSLKGSGWYSDLYSGKSKAKEGSDASPAATPAKAPTKPAETKKPSTPAKTSPSGGGSK